MKKTVLWLVVLFFIAGCLSQSGISPVSPTPGSATETAVIPLAPTFTSNPTLAPTITLTPTLAPTSTPLPPLAVSYYHLRLEYLTTSDWTDLEFSDTSNILSLRLVETQGSPTQTGATLQRLSLSQPLDESQPMPVVGMTVDYAVSPQALAQPLSLVLTKGDVGYSIVRLYLLGTGDPQLLREVTHEGRISGSAGVNPLPFELDLSTLAGVSPLEAQIGHPTRKMLWAFYYPWYSNSDWTSPILLDHPQTRYSSDDPEAIARQIEQAQSAGIDGFISSWWGPGDYTDNNLELLLSSAQERGFSVSIYFETLSSNGPRGEAQILDWLSYAISRYGSHPAFFKVDGKPLIVIWSSTSVPLETWRNVFSSLRSQGKEAVFLAIGYDLANLAVFDGIHEYGVFNIPDLAQVDRTTGLAVRYYALLSDPPETKIWVATVQPGYDDRLIPDRNGGVVQARQEGQFYRSTFEAALPSDPDWIFISTWNEWWEHTYIEPSELYGDLYLQITREFSDLWKR